ncbi:MAG: hypothetical protein ACJ8LG_25020 [Massilia sp.]
MPCREAAIAADNIAVAIGNEQGTHARDRAPQRSQFRVVAVALAGSRMVCGRFPHAVERVAQPNHLAPQVVVDDARLRCHPRRFGGFGQALLGPGKVSANDGAA